MSLTFQNPNANLIWKKKYNVVNGERQIILLLTFLIVPSITYMMFVNLRDFASHDSFRETFSFV